MRSHLFRALLSGLCFLSLSANALDTTYLKMAEPKGWKCAHDGQSWICALGNLRRPLGLLELKAQLLPTSTKYTLIDAEIAQRKLGTVTDRVGRASKEELRYQHRVAMAGLEWVEAMKANSGRPGMITHQWVAVLPTAQGAFLLTINAGYQPSSVATLDREVTAALHSIHLSPHVIDYVEYLSVPEAQRDTLVPQIVVGAPAGSKAPACAANKKLEMTVGTGRMFAYPLRVAGVAVIEKSRSLEMVATHVPYVMSTLLFSPMAEGRADVYVFDRTQKCRVHYAVGVQADSTRLTGVPREWTAQTIRTPSSSAEADAEYARLGTAVVAGHLEPGNPVGAVPFPTDGTMWISDPRIFDTVRLKPEKDHSTRLALIAKHPGTTSLVILDPKGRGRGYRVTVDAHGMRLEPMAMGQYEGEL